jgi:hypothetical protein
MTLYNQFCPLFDVIKKRTKFNKKNSLNTQIDVVVIYKYNNVNISFHITLISMLH